MQVKLTKDQLILMCVKETWITQWHKDSLPDEYIFEAEPVETEDKSYMGGGGGSGGSNYGYQLVDMKIQEIKEIEELKRIPNKDFDYPGVKDWPPHNGILMDKINELIRAWNSQ